MTVRGIQRFGGIVGALLTAIAMSDAFSLYFFTGEDQFTSYFSHFVVVGIGTIVLVLVAISTSLAAIDENTFKTNED